MAIVKRSRAEKGQSLVELALSMPLLILLLSGMLDLGRVYFTYVALEEAVGEAALYLSINPGCRTPADGADCVNPNNAEYRARYAGGGEIDWTKVTLTMNVFSQTVGDPVYVRIAYRFRLITPTIPQIAGVNPLTISVEASQVIISEEP